MEEIIDIAIEEVSSKWIINHQNMIIKYANRNVEFSDYLLMQTTHNYVKTLEKNFKKNLEDKRKSNPLYLEEELVEELGYSIKDIKSPRFSELVYKVLKNKKNEIMDIIKNRNYNSAPSFSMTVRNNKKISFNGIDLEKGIQVVIPKIRDFDPNFIKDIKEKVSQLDNKLIKHPRERLPYETDEEYENYLKDFYDGGSSKK